MEEEGQMEAYQMELEAAGHRGTFGARRPVGRGLRMDCTGEASEDTAVEDGERRLLQRMSDPCALVEVLDDPGDMDGDNLPGMDWEEVDSPWTEDS